MILLGNHHKLTLSHFHHALSKGEHLHITPETQHTLEEARNFIQHLLKKKIKAYGISTGYADLRDCVVSPEEADQLSENIINSHDGAIGVFLSQQVTLGAMIVRANSLSKGHSGFRYESLKTLVDMINAQIIPMIRSNGSLGASGDLAFLSRLGRAMMGQDVPVWHKGEISNAHQALIQETITPFTPKAKEGLALTNGTAFMASQAAIGVIQEIDFLENYFALLALFLCSVHAIDAAFYHVLQKVRIHPGQQFIARWIQSLLETTDFIDTQGTQNDYCIRCLPQILGPKLELLRWCYKIVENELDAVTDNPLIFKKSEISKDIHSARIIQYNGAPWVIISGGNFHGEYLTTIADSLLAANAKICLTIERQMTYLLNPLRHKVNLPDYLIAQREKKGVLSGCMITQYTGNALTHRICQLGLPSSIFNISSANESEDIVSYGATATAKLMEQQELMKQLLSVYLTLVAQSYSLACMESTNKIHSPICAAIHHTICSNFGALTFPLLRDQSFDPYFTEGQSLLSSGLIRNHLPFSIEKDYIKQNEFTFDAMHATSTTFHDASLYLNKTT